MLQPTPSGQLYGQTLRPYPSYQQVSANSDFAGDTYYNSLQATLERRFSSGSTVLANYSWSKLISNTEGINTYFEAGTVGAIQDYTNLRAERSLGNFDVRQRFVLSYILDLPFGQGERYLEDVSGITSKVVSGWKVAGITTFASGFPMTITSAAPNELSTLFGAGTIRPNVMTGCNKSVAGSIVGAAIAGAPVLSQACFAAQVRSRLETSPASTRRCGREASTTGIFRLRRLRQSLSESVSFWARSFLTPSTGYSSDPRILPSGGLCSARLRAR